MLCYIYLSNSEHNFTTDELVSMFNNHLTSILVLISPFWRNVNEELRILKRKCRKAKRKCKRAN